MALNLSSTFLPRPPPTLSTHKSNLPAGRRTQSQLQITCRKNEIHPEFHEASKVYCNNELVMTTGGTKDEYVVDVWSGNHPFYLGNRSGVTQDADQVEKFRKKYAGLEEIMEIPVLKGEIILPSKRKAAGKGKKK